MSEKRFYIDTIDGGESVLTNNGKELSLNETCNLLNELNDKIELIEIDKRNLHHLDAHNRIKILELRKENHELEKENKELNSIKHFADTHGINIFNIDEAFRKCWNDNKRLVIKNNELQERNNRQYKQLGDLYRLIEEKDWRALSDIMDDFKKSEELLQKEWSNFE